MSNIVKCKTCGKDVSKSAPTCPHCGEGAPGVRIPCPKCGSLSFTVGQQGFSLGKAAAGGLLLGPVGLLGGVLGRKKVELTCLKCSQSWTPDPRKLA
jgi:tellurium resistance protein TerD